MTNTIHLWVENSVKPNKQWNRIEILVENLKPSQKFRLWYDIPLAFQQDLSSNCDPFVVAVILMAMRTGSNLVVHGVVSPSLLKNIEEFQAAWSQWRPGYYRWVDISAEGEWEPVCASEARAIAAFSGGVDSCFTSFRHAKALCGRLQENLQAGIMIHGFDIPLHQLEAFERSMRRSRVMLESLDLSIIPVRTNFRELAQELRLNWEEVFGVGVASCLHLFHGGYSAGLIPSSFPYRALSFPYGSNPVTDPLLSSHAFRIVHDGAVAARLEKMRSIAQWPEALANLRVCWQGGLYDRNCGRCEKCIRTILNFRILGVGLPPCFEADISDRAIAETLVEAGPLTEMERVLEAAQAAQITESWVNALEQCIRRSRRHVALQRSRTWLKDHLPDPLLQAGRRLRRP